MRWLKRLLLSIYLYLGVVYGVCLVLWVITGEEPSSLIMGISAAVGVESVAAGAIRVFEQKQTNEHEKEMRNNEKSRLGEETDEP